MSNSTRISKLSRIDKPSFVSLMSKAFARDPLFLHLFGQIDSVPNQKTHPHVTTFVSFLFNNSVWLNEEIWGYFENDVLLGAYIAETPHTKKSWSMRTLGLAGGMIALLFRLPNNTLRELNAYMRTTRSNTSNIPHHYLIMIGVAPEAQGKGIGKALLQHLLQAVDTNQISKGVALDTENIQNVALYERFGFTLIKETYLEQLPIYCMFRPRK